MSSVCVSTGLAYGPDPAQCGDLHLPKGARPPVVCLLHGGFWRMPYGYDQMTPLADDLARRGYAAWNLEYRRVGAAGGGWPGTFQDVSAGIDHLATLAGQGAELDLARVVAVGHSAGGHLALWAAGRERVGGSFGWAEPRVRLAGAVGQAPLPDLIAAYELGGSVAALIGASPEDRPEIYAAASPRALLPHAIPQLIVHGDRDEAVSIDLARRYVDDARAKGDAVDFVELPGAGHFEHIDVTTAAWAAVIDWLEGNFPVR
jgi:acetyl esterase/lipase